MRTELRLAPDLLDSQDCLLTSVLNARLESSLGEQSLFDITISTSSTAPSISSLDAQNPSSGGPINSCSLHLPSLAHPHIHLDKAFLLSHPRYADYVIEKGDFNEAFVKTTEAKRRYTHEDLIERGRWVLSESVNAGVTAVRAFVEVDATVQFKCLDAAIQLKEEFKDLCTVQICAYAQDPLLTTENGPENTLLMTEAIKRPEVEVLGTTPYVEKSREAAKSNVDWAIQMALETEKMLDFHLDYSLDPIDHSMNNATEPLLYYLLTRLEATRWTTAQPANKQTILLGHCTRLTLLSNSQWDSLASRLQTLGLKDKLVFVGLPTSDTYMMGRPSESSIHASRPRGTLMIPHLIKSYGLNALIGVNNIGNMYTPHGSCDPLALISHCVGLYQAGTVEDTRLLYECVSTRAKRAMGLLEDQAKGDYPGIVEGGPVDFVVFAGVSEEKIMDHNHGIEGKRKVLGIKKRPKLRISDIVLDPPEVAERGLVFKGKMIKRA